MTESTAEIPQPTGIQLVSEEDHLVFLKTKVSDSFTTQRKLIPSLGEIYLWGCRDWKYEADQMGIAIIGDSIIIDKAQSLKDRGLYDLEVKIGGLPQPTIPIACTLIIPQQNTALEGKFWFGKDDLETDLTYKYHGRVDTWKRLNDDREYIFFAPANAEALSHLRFSFKSLPQASTPLVNG